MERAIQCLLKPQDTSFFYHEVLIPYLHKTNRKLSFRELEALIWSFEKSGNQIDLPNLKRIAESEAVVIGHRTGIKPKYIVQYQAFKVLSRYIRYVESQTKSEPRAAKYR